MTQVTFSSAVGGDGTVISDDSDPTTGLKNGGHRTLFVKALEQLVAVASFVVTKAAEVAANVLAAQSAAFTPATSTTSVALASSGAVSFTTQSGKTFPVGYRLRAASNANPDTHYMDFVVSSYAGTSLQGTATAKGSGTGSRADWTFSPAGSGGDVSSTRAINTSGLASGGGNLTADRTIVVTKCTAADMRAGNEDNRAVTPKQAMDALLIQTLTDGATIAWDMGAAANAKVTLGGNRSLAQPTNYKEGASYALDIIQDATGSRTLSFASCYDFGTVGAPTLNIVAGKRDRVFFYCYDAATPKFAASFWKAA